MLLVLFQVVENIVKELLLIQILLLNLPVGSEFKLYLITEFERLKANEAYQYKIEWSATRLLSKVNYVVHTDAIKKCIVPTLTEKQKQFVYAEEADVLSCVIWNDRKRMAKK